MSLSELQITLIQSTFTMVAPSADTVAELFYNRLFEIDPSLRALFKHDMRLQGQMLMQMLGMVIGSLDTLDQLIPKLQQLGQRHVHYGVQREQYDTVGAALLWTLDKGLGSHFTPDVKEAWTTAYGILTEAITAGLYVEETT